MEHNFKTFDKILWRVSDENVWSAGHYERQAEADGRHMVIGHHMPLLCVPFEGNEHLLHTRNSPLTKACVYSFGDLVDVKDGDKWVRCAYMAYNPKNGHHRAVAADVMYDNITDDEIRRAMKCAETQCAPVKYQWGDKVEVLTGGTTWKEAIYIKSRCDNEGWQHVALVEGQECGITYDDDEVRPIKRAS